MIPTRAEDLDELVDEVARQTEEVSAHVAGVGDDALSWRPLPQKWSVSEHLAHLVLTNGRYLDAIEPVVRRARERGGPLGDGPYRHPWVASRFVRTLEPPPKVRVKTFRSLVPPADPPAPVAMPRFAAMQDRLALALQSARGLDLGRVRLSSPLLRILRLSLGTAFAVVLAHNRRHIWLIAEVNRLRPEG